MKKILCTVMLSAIYGDCKANIIEIQPIQQHQIPAARAIIMDAVFELQIIPCTSIKALQEIVEQTGEVDDLNYISNLYQNNKGLFLVSTQNNIVIGMGALKRLDDTICELKRMFFVREFRAKGLGTQMLTHLLQKAKELGYKKMRLDVYNPATQIGAVNLYKKFGFYEIDPYKTSRAKIFMEKILS